MFGVLGLGFMVERLGFRGLGLRLEVGGFRVLWGGVAGVALEHFVSPFGIRVLGFSGL